MREAHDLTSQYFIKQQQCDNNKGRHSGNDRRRIYERRALRPINTLNVAIIVTLTYWSSASLQEMAAAITRIYVLTARETDERIINFINA